MAYRFANQSEVKELTACCMKILYAVQDEVSDYFTFDIRLIGSGDKRLVTQNSDESFDLDYNIILQKDKKGLLDNPKQIKDIFVARFNKVLKQCVSGYIHVSDSTSVVKIECCKKIFDQIICPLELWDKTFVNYNDIVHLSPIRPANKKDCVQLLLLFDNAHEFAAVVNACLYVKRTIDRRI